MFLSSLPFWWICSIVINAETLSTMVIALFASLPPTILAFATLVRSNKVDKKLDNTEILAKKSDKKLDEIHTLTNNNLTMVKTELALANSKIESLKILIEEIRKRNNVLVPRNDT